jgi:hypothetical protein
MHVTLGFIIVKEAKVYFPTLNIELLANSQTCQ